MVLYKSSWGNEMKILTIMPPMVPSYFNAGHHLPVFQVATFLEKSFPEYSIDSVDGSALNLHWKNICDLLVKRFDLVCIYCDFDGIDGLERLIYYIRSFSKETKILLFGRLCKQSANTFMQFNPDAIHIAGDYEVGVEEYIKFINNPEYQPKGIKTDAYTSNYVPDFPVDRWVMPDVTRIPYDAYNRMYSNDLDKFCGIPDRQELVVPVSRGCPINCSFCDVPFMQGLKERRYDVQMTIDYIKDSFNKLPFKYVTFYSPTFTLNNRWVKELCKRLSSEGRIYPWKCTTALPTLKDELIPLMAKAGCVRISLGIESFSPKVTEALPKCKQESRASFEHIVKLCEEHGIELNCFIILGLPGDTPEEAEYTINAALKAGARIRPTIFTPYNLITENTDKSELFKFNRQIFYQSEFLSATDIEAYYKLFYANKNDVATQVMEKI